MLAQGTFTTWEFRGTITTGIADGENNVGNRYNVWFVMDTSRLAAVASGYYEPTVLVHFIAAGLADGFDSALERHAMRAAQQLDGLLVPEIDAALEADRQRSFGDFFQQRSNLLANAENLVNEVDVIDAARHEGIDFGKYGADVALAEFIAEQRLIAERAGP